MTVETFQNKGCEEEGKIFIASKRCPAYEKVSAEIFPGDRFLIFCYFDEGIYMLENQTRPAQNCYVGDEEMYALIDTSKPVEVKPAPIIVLPKHYGVVYKWCDWTDIKYIGVNGKMARSTYDRLDETEKSNIDSGHGELVIQTWENDVMVFEECYDEGKWDPTINFRK